MAELRWTPNNEGPVNEGERRVVRELAQVLPDSFVILPNLELTLDRGRSRAECDAVIVGPDCVWVVEIKDLAGVVEVGEHDFVVNGELRSHPARSTRLKAQRLKSRLSRRRELASVWVQPIVVLARAPRQLTVVPAMRSQVMPLPLGLNAIVDPSEIGLDRNRISSSQHALILSEILGTAATRRPHERFGEWLGEERVAEGAGEEWWLARSATFENDRVTLQVVRRDPAWAAEDWESRRKRAMRAVHVGRRIGANPRISAPQNAFIHTDGSVVVVHAELPTATLETIDLSGLEEKGRRQILADSANGIAEAHAHQVAHRMLGPAHIYVRDGRARVGGFSTAQLDTAEGTISVDSWPSFGGFWDAPEHLRQDVGPEADLWALGKLIEFLWADGTIPPDLRTIANSLLVNEPTDRSPSAKELAALLSPSVRSANAKTKLEKGAVLGDRYRLVEALGHGATSSVWHAIDQYQADQPVALKLFTVSGSGDWAAAEFSALHRSVHPNIVRVSHVDRVDSGFVLATELLRGPTLSELIADATSVSEDDAVSVALHLLDALSSIHPDLDAIEDLRSANPDDVDQRIAELRSQAIVHRDIKPQNIVLTNDRGPVLVDFGLAVPPGDAVAGLTPAYLPADGSPNSAAPDNDLFAVAVVLHELLTGSHPYQDRDPLGGQLKVSTEIGSELRAVVAKGCARKRAERFRTSTEFLQALQSLGFDATPVPDPARDIVETTQALRQAIRNQNWEQARALCRPQWKEQLEQIDRAERSFAAAEEVQIIATVGSFELRLESEREFDIATDTGNTERGPGVCRLYLGTGPADTLVQIEAYDAQDGTQWLTCPDAFQSAPEFQRLTSGLRLQSVPGEDASRSFLVGITRFKPGAKRGSSINKAELAELDSVAGGDIKHLLIEAGATRVGTRGELLNDTSSRKGYTCAVDATGSAEHLGPVVYFATRILPIARHLELQ